MPMFLAAIGWISDSPIGNRLRWTIDPKEIRHGQFRGLPDVVTLQRAPLEGSIANTIGGDTNTFPVPISWWEDLGDMHLSGMFPCHVTLPEPVQALRFDYAGSDAFYRAWNGSGAERTLVEERVLSNGESVLLESTFITDLEFFTNAVNLQHVSVLNLFVNHAAGLHFDTIARLAPNATRGMSLEGAYQRYGGTPTLDHDEWTEFQEVALADALASSPGDQSQESPQPTAWEEVELLLSARWEYAVVCGFGFLDGPDAGPGTSSDQIRDILLSAIGTVTHVYRATATFADGSTDHSNLIVIPPFPVFPLPVPTNLGYTNPEVRLYGDESYIVTDSLHWQVGSHRIIGAELVEEVASSPILDSAPEVIPLTFRSPNPAAVFPEMSMVRRFNVPFYDVPLRFRARSVDGWDRTSAFSPWSPQVVPTFIHNPVGPPLREARFDGATITLRAQTDHQKFTDWSPDHAVAHTPGSQLEILRRMTEPDSVEVNFAAPSFYQNDLNTPVRLYTVPVPPLLDPGKFVGGFLSSGVFRAEILRIENGQFVFEPISDSTSGTDLFEAGPGRLQQAPNHPDLFTFVTQFPAVGLPERLEFPDVIAPATETTRTEYYAVRVRMGAIRGAVGNTAQAIVVPDIPEAPPPFAVEYLGVDFYDRTLVRISFLDNVMAGKYRLFCAEGNHDEESFNSSAMAGDFGAQELQDNHYIYELFSLPIPKTMEAPFTFGAQRETSGAYRSGFTLVHTVVPVYVP